MDEPTTNSRCISVPVGEILDLVSCSGTYGFADDVLLDAFAGWLDRKITDEDVEIYIKEYYRADSNYTDEDREDAREAIADWREKYCRPRG